MTFTRLFALGALALTISLVACRVKAPAPTVAVLAPTSVHWAQVATGPALPPVRASGLLMAKDAMRLSFKVGGIVSQLEVREGDQVRRGQVLATIEQAEIAAQVAQAQLLRDKSQRDLKRGEQLYAESVIALEQVQDLRTQASVSAAQFASVSFNSQFAKIVAPADGVVLRRLAEERELVSAGQAILAVSSADAGFVLRAALADREVVSVQVGDSVKVRMDAYPEREFDASISEIASAADDRSGLFMVEAKLLEPPERLRSGLVGRLEMTPDITGAAPLVYLPLSSVVEGDGRRASAFTVKNGVVKRVAVQIAFIDREHVALLSGVAVGETVVTEGALFLADGEKVTLKKD